MAPIDDILRQVILLLACVFGIGWLTYAATFKREPCIAILFCFANWFTGVGVWLVSQRAGTPNYLMYQCADWLVLTGFTFILVGVQKALTTRKYANWIAFIPLLLDLAITAGAAPDTSSYLRRALSLNGLSCLVFIAIAVEVHFGFKQRNSPSHRNFLIEMPAAYP